MTVEDTSEPGFGTNEAFRGQQWGGFPTDPNVPFQPLAWAQVNADGTIASQSSGNLLSTIKGSAGNYIMMPAGKLVGFPTARMLATAIATDDVPGIPTTAYGLGPGSAGVSVVFTVGSTPTDLPFLFLLWQGN